MDKRYGVFNTAIQAFVNFEDGVLHDLRTAKSRARVWNAAMKPEHQSYTVVTVIFDPEVDVPVIGRQGFQAPIVPTQYT